MVLKSYVLRNVPGNPSFRHVVISDVNELSGNRKRRIISCPNDAMRLIHRRFIRCLRSLGPNLPNATACRPRCSVVSGLSRHCGNRYFYSLDLADAYRSVDLGTLAGQLERVELCERSESLAFLNRFCAGPRGGLAVGGPASSDLFNLYAGLLLDQCLAERVRIWGGCYTRYLDDLLISMPEARGPLGKRKRECIRFDVKRAGFAISHHKSRVVDLEVSPILVNGFGLDRTGRIFVPDPFLRRLRFQLLLALRGLDCDKDKIRGRCAFLFGGKPRRYTRMEGEVYQLYRNWQRLEKKK